MEVKLRSMLSDDWDQVAEIFREGIETKNATFETMIPSFEEWDLAHIRSCRIVATIENNVAGWAVLKPFSARDVYSGVGEVSIYVSNKYKGLKIGTRLMVRLIEESEKEGFWTLQAGIFRENTPSIKLHENHGFRMIGYREKIGQMDGTWRDTILLERRSKKIGSKNSQML